MKISFDMQCNRLNLFYRKRADNSKYSTRLCRWKDRMELTDWVWHCTKYRHRQGKQQTTARQSALSDKWSECDILARIPGSSWELPTAVPSALLTTFQMIHEISFYLLRSYFLLFTLKRDSIIALLGKIKRTYERKWQFW